MKDKHIILIIGFFWLVFTLITWVFPIQEISQSERRVLAQIPPLEFKTVFSGKYMKDFEEYAKDQFPFRFTFRSIKARIRFNMLLQRDNNGIYIEDGFAAKLEYPLNEKSVDTANKKFRYLFDKYMKDKNVNVYISIIPDKNYYLGVPKGYPSMDYDRLFELVEKGCEFARYIDLTDTLSIESYYKTDIHWKQEKLTDVVKRIASAMGINNHLSMDFVQSETQIPFHGVYMGQSALPLKPDSIDYLTNETIENSWVYNLETDKTTPLYDREKLNSRDPYDFYLHGATALLTIENPLAKTTRELVVFRDSFASSLVPLLLEGYSKITLIDIRYIHSDLVGEYVEFKEQDILFLYNTLLINTATMCECQS